MVNRLTQGEMDKVGVEILEKDQAVWLRCKNCGATWSPNIQRGGRLPRGYWHCPNGCNVRQ
jgi:hypothetical protein